MSPKKSVIPPVASAQKEGYDRVALFLSIIPGLGHFYKGHYRVGLVLLFVGTPVVLWTSILISLATLGFGLVLPLIYWALVALNAYWEPDWRAQHHLNWV